MEKYEITEEPAMQDELAELSGEQLIENLKADVKAYEKSLEQAYKDKENYEKQFELDKQIYEILMKPGMLEMIRPTYKYQVDPEFQKLQEQKQAFKIRQDLAIGEGSIKQYDVQIETITKALESAKEKLARFSKED